MQVLIDKFVKPTNPIIDYNTRYPRMTGHPFYRTFSDVIPKYLVFLVLLVICCRYSGITSEMLNNVTTTLSDIQVKFYAFSQNKSGTKYQLFILLKYPKRTISKLLQPESVQKLDTPEGTE
jgi:hypothetical protein